MYHRSRILHRWVGIVCALFLVVIAGTGFLLAVKGRVPWMRPPLAEALPIQDPSEIIPMDQVLEAAFNVGHAKLSSIEHVDRVDYRPKDNVFKVLSNEGYHEVQVCGKSGRVVSDFLRNDQLVEDIHDMSFFAEAAHAYVLPAVGVGLFALGLTGIGIFFTPMVRRWRFRAGKR